MATTSWLSPKDIAGRFNVSIKVVQGWIRNGELPAIQVGRRVLEQDLLNFIAGRERVLPAPRRKKRAHSGTNTQFYK
jgi:excisionase family DNA binding protein